MSLVSWPCLPCRRRGGGGGVRQRLRGEAPGHVSVYGGAWRGEEAAVAAANAACAADMEASAAAHGEHVVTATRGGSAAVRCDVVRAKSTVVAETRRSRRTCVVAQRSRRLGATTMEAHGTEPRRPWRTCAVAWRGGMEVLLCG
ncbi:hypothetical protein VPH35_010911 [Triticum aestivum]